MATHHVAAKYLTLSRYTIGSSSRFESYTPGRACPQSNSANQIARPGGHQPRLKKLLDFPDMELIAERTFEPLGDECALSSSLLSPQSNEALSFVSQC
jgi:hypothetical protein